MSELTLESIQAPHVTVEPARPGNEAILTWVSLDRRAVVVRFGDGVQATFQASWLRKIAEGA